MKKMYYLLVILIFGGINTAFAQMHHGWGFDSLDVVTVSGTAIVVENDSMRHPVYFLDEDNDGNADYHLNFGPFWYRPDSSDAVRPEDGEQITITGILRGNKHFDIPNLIVLKINGQFWSRPLSGLWHRFFHRHFGGHGLRWNIDSLETLELSGIAIVDTSFFMDHYFLDTDSDSLPDYILNFGPPWYNPKSGAARPNDGDQITVKGGVLGMDRETPMVLVFELNGVEWRDTSRFGRFFGGGWMHRNMDRPMTFRAPFDEDDMFTVHPGWAGSGMGGGMMFPDSVFCEFNEVYPDDLPSGNEAMGMFAGYQLDLYKPDGQSMMQGGMGGMMKMNSSADFTLHYSDEQLQMYAVDESTIKVKVWNPDLNNWQDVSATLDEQNNLISFSSSQVSSYIALSADAVTSVNDESEVIPSKFSLSQNYPNPFNPTTTIKFSIPENSNVKLDVFNLLGQRIYSLVNGYKNAGEYTVVFNASSLASGIYVYKLSAGNFVATRKMILMK